MMATLAIRISAEALCWSALLRRDATFIFGLLTEFIFVFEDSLDDTVVGPQNDDQRDQVVGDAQQQDGDLVGEGLCDVIVRASS